MTSRASPRRSDCTMSDPPSANMTPIDGNTMLIQPSPKAW